MKVFQLTDTPADIVNTYPKASDFFKKEKIDYCCGGDQPLKTLIEKKKRPVDGEALVQLINTSYQKWKEAGNENVKWDELSDRELIEYILKHHHQYLNEELAPLSQFVTKIYRVHGDVHPHLEELFKLFHQFKMEMEGHMIEEERDLFPLIEKYDKEPSDKLRTHILKLSEMMVEDHAFVGDILKKMNKITNDYTLPEGACNSYRITYARLQELESNTFDHIHLENNVLFQSIT